MNYKVGDLVQVREWDDMVEEFGLRKGNIPCTQTFVKSMRRFCGKSFSVSEVRWEGDPQKSYYVLDGIAGWVFSDDMLVQQNFDDELTCDSVEDFESFLLK